MHDEQQVATPDRTPHSSVQAWSRGPIFPAVIARAEHYARPMTHAEWAAANTQLARHDQSERFYRSYVNWVMERPVADRLIRTEWVLTIPGHDEMGFGSYDDAMSTARALLAYDAEIAEAIRQRAGRPSRGVFDLASAWINGLRVAA